jgi:protein required for attachment to host cells
VLLPRNSLVAVTDGARFILYRNEGTATELRLKREDAMELVLPSSAEMGSAPPGRSFQSFGNRRSAYESPDVHDIAETRFTAEVAERVTDLVNAGESLLLAADPRSLGHLRKHLPDSVRSRILGEIAADYSKHTPEDLGRLLASIQI